MAKLREVRESERARVKITALKAMQLRDHGQSLVKIETDSGLFGLGEAGAPGPVVRAHLKDYFEAILIGQDPLCIEKLYAHMTRDRSQWQARYVHMPTVSGLDIALWDLAGKILGRSVSELLTGRFREKAELYVNDGGPESWLDKGSCKAWAAEARASRYGWKTLKIGFERLLGRGLAKDRYFPGSPSPTLYPTDLRIIRQGYENVREALGWETDIIIHCHNEWDIVSALGIAEAVAPIHPQWLEDALPVPYSESWKALKDKSPVRIMTGEKLELLAEFRPFLTNAAVDVLHPDLAYAGGFTGCRKVADLAELYYVPVVLHCVGSLVQLLASGHFGASVRGFIMSENRIPSGGLYEQMNEGGVTVKDGLLTLPDGPGLGIDFVPEVVRDARAPGEPDWG